MISTGNKMLSNIQGIPVISVIYGLSLQLLYGKLEKSLKCQKVWYDFFWIFVFPVCVLLSNSGHLVVAICQEIHPISTEPLVGVY